MSNGSSVSKIGSLDYQQLAKVLDTALNGDGPKTIGFALFLFEFGKTEGGCVNYVSNADRADMLIAVREWLARHEGRYAVQGGAA